MQNNKASPSAGGKVGHLWAVPPLAAIGAPPNYITNCVGIEPRMTGCKSNTLTL